MNDETRKLRDEFVNALGIYEDKLCCAVATLTEDSHLAAYKLGELGDRMDTFCSKLEDME